MELPCGKTALAKLALMHDIDHLLKTFEATPIADYSSFVSSWRKSSLALVHFACPQGQARHSFMETIYDFFLDHLTTGSLKSQVGAVFGLFMCYFTQPPLFKKVAIRLTTTQWKSIQDLYLRAFQMDGLDLISVIYQLRQRNAFTFTAKSKVNASPMTDESADLAAFAENTLLHLEKDTLDTNGLIPVAPLMTDLYDMSTKYYYAKRDLVTLSLTRKASGAVLTHLAKQHPEEINLRHAEPIPSFILKEHQAGGKVIPASAMGEQIINTSENQENQEQPHALVDLLLKAQEKPQMNPKGTTEKLKNELPALPEIFPISILQASRSDYIRDVEAVVTSYVHEQYSRYKFATTGALRRNDYEFLPPRQVEKRTPQEQFAYEQLQRTKRKKLKLKIKEEKRQARDRAKAGDKSAAEEAKSAEHLQEHGETEGAALLSSSVKHGVDLDLEELGNNGHQDEGQDGGSDTAQPDDSFDPYAELLRTVTLPRDGSM